MTGQWRAMSGTASVGVLLERDGSGALHGPALLCAALDQLDGALGAVRQDGLGAPTPCGRWDLGMLLAHVAESLAALEEGFGRGAVALTGAPAAAGNPVAAVRTASRRVREGAVGAGAPDAAVAVADRALGLSAMAAVGALETAVHAWDIDRSTGSDADLPDALAEPLAAVVPLVVTEGTRPGLFAAPVPVSADASATGHLVASLGRTP
ncbi:TIGR03086 family metal-binding protein [Nocardiopsis coralliicola]